MIEDKKSSVEIGTSLSSSLMNASLTMLTILAALFVFIIEKRQISFIYYLLASLSFISFVVSVFYGGKGINKARKNMFFGNYNSRKTKPLYNYQAIYCLLGISLFIISIFFTKSNNKESDKLDIINTNIVKIIKLEEERRRVETQLNLKIKQLENRIEKLETNRIHK